MPLNPKIINLVQSECRPFALPLNKDFSSLCLETNEARLSLDNNSLLRPDVRPLLLSQYTGSARMATLTCPSSSVPCVAPTSRGTRAAHRCCARAANIPSAGTVCRTWTWVSQMCCRMLDEPSVDIFTFILHTVYSHAHDILSLYVPKQCVNALTDCNAVLCTFCNCRVISSWGIMIKGRAETNWDTPGLRLCGIEHRWG